jgi:hypothetical protein
MPLQSTSGAASYDAFGGGVAVAPNYIEDVFSTYLYTGNGSTQTITNGIDLDGEGGLVWIKSRSAGGYNNTLYDTVRGATNRLVSNDADVQNTSATSLTSFSSTGFSLGSFILSNESAQTYVSWTFRKQPKFFDIVTYTGNGSNRTIAHDLGSVPGCVIVKRTDTSGDWKMYHLGLTSAAYALNLNNNGSPEALETTVWNSTAPTSTVFSVGTATSVNASGGTYVAYIFAHNAGGFGLSGLDNVISCGTYNGTGGSTATTVNLGFEPQFVFISNRTYGTANLIFDSMRGIVTGGNDPTLSPSLSGAENAAAGAANLIDLNATGFTINASSYDVTDRSGSTYIYIAIRRGPMKVPTSGTSVFAPITRTGTGANATVTGTGFPVDMLWSFSRTPTTGVAAGIRDRLRGVKKLMVSERTTAETSITETTGVLTFTMDGMTVGADAEWETVNRSGNSYIYWFMRRAPSFFDVVCYTGNSTARTVAHNLAAVPELMIIKARTGSGLSWVVYAGNNKYLWLQSTNEQNNAAAGYFNNTAPTSTVFSVGTDSDVNGSGNTYVAYLFATCAGVSKIGSYTGNGSSQTINCGFTGGARFVMIKRTDNTGDWYVWDSARGIVAGNDPHLSLNTTAAEVTTDDSVDTDSTGFVVNQVAATNVNVTSATYIFLAIA